jgi:hypothetical protein
LIFEVAEFNLSTSEINKENNCNNKIIIPTKTLVILVTAVVLGLVLMGPLMIMSSSAYTKYITGIDTLTQFDANSIVGIAAYYNQDDKFQHVIVGTKDGAVTEVYFNQKGIFRDVLTQFDANSIVRMAAYYAVADKFQHVMVVTTDGNVNEIYFNQKGIFRDVLTNIQGIVAITAYAAGCIDDGRSIGVTRHSCDQSHVAIATADGKITEINWGGIPYDAINQKVIGTSQGMTAIAAYYTYYSASAGFFDREAPSPDPGSTTSISSGGKICNPYLGQSVFIPCADADVLAQFDGIVGFAAYYNPTDRFYHAIVATNDGNVHEVFYKNNPTPPPLPPPPADVFNIKFAASPANPNSPSDGYIGVGDPVTLKWVVTGGSCPNKSNCQISLEGKGLLGDILFAKQSNLPSTGSMTIKPPVDTHYFLTVGSQSKSSWVTLYQKPGGPANDPCQTAGKCQFFYFKIVDPNSPCYTDAFFAPDAKTALNYLINQSPRDATVSQISEAAYLAGCS